MNPMLSSTAPSRWNRSLRWVACALVLAWVFVGPASAQLADTPWPKFSGDLQNTGQSPFGGEGQSWQQGQIGRARTAPIIAGDGTIYLGAGPSEETALHAIDPTGGAVQWSFNTDGPVGISPAIGSDGTIYTSGIVDPPDIVAVFPPRLGLYAITPDGTQEWFFSTSFTFAQGDFFDVVQTAPAIAADGTVYVGLGDEEVDSLYAINPDGTRKWAAGIGGNGLTSPSIAPDGTIYIGTNNGMLYAFNPDGTRKWAQAIGDFAVTSPALGTDGTIYVGVDDDALVSIRPDGSEQWRYPVLAFSITAPAVGSDGTIYMGVGSEGGNAFYAVHPDGTEQWTVETSGPIFTAPAVGAGGALYFGVYNSENSELVVLGSDGSERWRFGPVDSPRAPVTRAEDGTVYLASAGGLSSVVGPRIGLPLEPVDFGRIAVGGVAQRQMTVENTGDVDLTLTNISISGPDADAFSVVEGGGPVTIPPNEQHAVTVEFSSTSGGARQAQLTASGNTTSDTVELRGQVLSLDPGPLPTPRVGEPADITIALPEGFEPQSRSLFYRVSGTTAYQQIELSPTEDGARLAGSIPESAVTVRGIDFYVRLSGEEFTLTFPSESPIDDPAWLPVQFDQLMPAGTFEADTYRMISIPAVVEERELSAVFGDYGSYEPNRWRVVQWDSQEETYADLPDLQDVSATPGQAFWLITREGEPFTLPAGQATDASSPYEITLQPGWNQVGNPFAFPVSLATIDLPESIEGPVGFDGETYQRDVERLQPWSGYFFYNSTSSPATLSIPPVEASGDVESPSATAAVESTAHDATEATMQLSARLLDHDLRDTKNVIGLADGAETGRDRMDYAEVPPVGNHVRLSIMESGERLAGSFKPPDSEGQWWDLELSASVDEPFPSRKRVTVQIQAQGQPPEGYERYLIDRDAGETLSLEQGATTLVLDGARPTRRLRIIWGTKDFARTHAEGASVESYVNALYPNAPNPFTETTSIRYELRTPSRVVIAIYNMLGQRVRTLVDTQQKAGPHVVQWNGRNAQGIPVASGVYFCRLRADSFEAVRKLTRVR